MKLVFAIAGILSLNGCATIVNDSHIPLTASFSDGSSGQCNFKNKRGTWSSQIPTSTVMIRRSDDSLVFECETEDGRKATGFIRSEMEGGKLAASVVFFDLGITDAITDKHRTYQGNIVIPVAGKGAVIGQEPVVAPEFEIAGAAKSGSYDIAAAKLVNLDVCEKPVFVLKEASAEIYKTRCQDGNVGVIQCQEGKCAYLNAPKAGGRSVPDEAKSEALPNSEYAARQIAKEYGCTDSLAATDVTSDSAVWIAKCDEGRSLIIDCKFSYCEVRGS